MKQILILLVIVLVGVFLNTKNKLTMNIEVKYGEIGLRTFGTIGLLMALAGMLGIVFLLP